MQMHRALKLGMRNRPEPFTRLVAIRLPEWLLHNLKALANKRDVPYQSLLKMFVAEKVDEALTARTKA